MMNDSTAFRAKASVRQHQHEVGQDMPGLADQDVLSGLPVHQVRRLPDPEHSSEQSFLFISFTWRQGMSQELRLPWDESYFHTWDTNMSFSSMNSFSNMIKNFAAEKCKISCSTVSMLKASH